MSGWDVLLFFAMLGVGGALIGLWLAWMTERGHGLWIVPAAFFAAIAVAIGAAAFLVNASGGMA